MTKCVIQKLVYRKDIYVNLGVEVGSVCLKTICKMGINF